MMIKIKAGCIVLMGQNVKRLLRSGGLSVSPAVGSATAAINQQHNVQIALTFSLFPPLTASHSTSLFTGQPY